ncbi:MAG: YhcH/YjgK/YiaL family protein [Nitrospirae bacterium]|nr:YhcH/YjgK/YiaL family protein [Nitrospirota bacterium]
MIYDKLEHLNKYQCMHKHFTDVFRFIESGPLSERSDGKYEINDQGAYAVIETYETRDLSDCFIECHRKYIDVQVVIDGIECVGVCHRSSCAELPYDEEKDFQKLEGDTVLLTLGAGSFMIFYPDDAHMPKVRYGGSPGTVKKAVFKVPVQI